MAYEAELAALRAAYATGANSVSYDGNTVSYASGDEILKRIRVIEAQASPSSAPRRIMSTLTSFSRD